MNKELLHAKSSSEAQSDLNSQIEAEQIKSVYQQYPTIIFGGAAGSAVLAFLLWDQVAHARIFWWLGLIFTATAGFSLAFLWYRKTAQPPRDTHKWKVLMYLSAVPLAIAYGLIGILLYASDALEYQLLTIIWLWAIASMATSAMVAYKPIFYTLLVPFLLPVTLRLTVEMDSLHLALAVATIVYGGIQVFFYGNNHTTFLTALRLRYENIELVAKLTSQKEEAELANLAKSRFLAAASHDLRQPLHAQGLYVAALRQRICDDENKQILNDLEGSITTMGGLFNALLDISNLDAGVVQPTITSFPIQAVMDQLVRDYAGQAKEKNLEFEIVPSSAVVRTDQTLLTRILLNLVSNAVRYTNNGKITVACHEQNGKLNISCSDTGIGISEEEQKQIFQEFRQLRNPERDREKGLGLGLAIVHRLTTLLGHQLDVESKVGCGSRFQITVPLGALSDVDIAVVQGNSAVAYDLRGACVLVIDDDLSILKGMQNVLEDWGCITIVASSAKEGLAQLRSFDRAPDAIIADYWLHEGESGVDAIDLIRSATDANTPAILITGDTSPEGIRVTSASEHVLLHKPVPADELQVLLGYLIREKQTDDAAPQI